jgi:hypothetical protein
MQTYDALERCSSTASREHHLSEPEGLGRIGEHGGALANAVLSSARSEGASTAIDGVLADLSRS